MILIISATRQLKKKTKKQDRLTIKTESMTIVIVTVKKQTNKKNHCCDSG